MRLLLKVFCGSQDQYNHNFGLHLEKPLLRNSHPPQAGMPTIHPIGNAYRVIILPMIRAMRMPIPTAMGMPMTMCTGTSTIGKHASGPRLLGCGPLGLLDNVLHALGAHKQCDPRNSAMMRQCISDYLKKIIYIYFFVNFFQIYHSRFPKYRHLTVFVTSRTSRNWVFQQLDICLVFTHS